jgi:hypothetical protein
MTEYQNTSRGDKGRVYVIGCDVGCKIGWTSKDPRGRVRALQTGNPYPIHLVGSVEGTLEMEAAAHRRFEDYRMSGEWFDVNPFDALMWLIYDERMYRRRPARKFHPSGALNGMWAALEVYGHGEGTVWTMDGINAVLGRWPTDEELDEALYRKSLFVECVTVGDRTVRLYSLTPFADAE